MQLKVLLRPLPSMPFSCPPCPPDDMYAWRLLAALGASKEQGSEGCASLLIHAAALPFPIRRKSCAGGTAH